MTDGADSRATGPLRAAVALVALEAAGLAAAAVFLLVELAVATAANTAAAVFTACSAALGAAALALVARGLHRRRRWSRSPALLPQLFLLPIGFGVAQNAERRPLGVVLLVLGLAALAVLLSPAVGRQLE